MKHYIKTTLILSVVGIFAYYLAFVYSPSPERPFASLMAQQPRPALEPQQRINWTAPAPLSPMPSLGLTGAGGQTPYYYWIIANFPIGAATPAGPSVINGPGTLSAMNAIRVTWQAVTGATSYSVLKNTSPTFPLTAGACAACALSASTTLTALTDTGGALAAFTLGASIPTATGYMYLDNRDASSPRFVISPGIVGPSGSSNVFVNIDGTQSLTGTGEIVYLGTTGLEGTTDYLRNATTGTVTHVVSSATFPLPDGYLLEGYGATQPGIQIRYAGGTQATPLYPNVGDPLLTLSAMGYNENTIGFAQGAGIIVDAGTNWSATNNDASMDFYINETGTVGNGITLLTLSPTAMRVGVGYSINQVTGGLDGTLHVMDNRATTGDTSLVIQEGDGQAANFLEVQNNAGTAIASIDPTGGFRPAAIAFASLGTPADGVIVYCSDCDVASSPCASTPGTGAFALRQSGAWECQ